MQRKRKTNIGNLGNTKQKGETGILGQGHAKNKKKMEGWEFGGKKEKDFGG